MIEEPRFPPLIIGHEVTGQADPFVTACGLAARGCDGGTLVHNLQADRLRAAMVFAPEVPLRQAMAMMPLCGVGFQNALGALAPPEVAVHLQWDGTIKVNGARCGGFQVAAAGDDPEDEPEWLVIGLELALLPTGRGDGDAGFTPDITTLSEEGCADLEAGLLLEAWARHTLNWINRWADGGRSALHEAWIGLVQEVGDSVQIGERTGTFVGVDEDFGMLLRDKSTTHLIPLTRLLAG
ncbi:MAG: DUF4444 domain-containing protein [Rhodobacteraceae bacterium]|nr:DUF4444 domain-containing protein [Paracoccaceae bacterium]